MILLQNSAIEPPESLFEIELVVFGSINRCAVRRTVNVLAQTTRGAKRICLSRYGRAEIKRAQKAGKTQAGQTPDMFNEELALCSAM